MRTLCIVSLLGSSLAAAQPSPEVSQLLKRQTEETYAELKKLVPPGSCVVSLPDKPTLVANNKLGAAATLTGGKVQVLVSTGEVTWLALASNLADRRSAVHWNKLFGSMASLTSGTFDSPAKLPAWSDFEAESWGAWRAGFQTRMAFVLAHELGHACLGHLAAPDASTGTDCDPVSLGIAKCLSPRQCREAKADQWAVGLIKKNAKHLGVPAEGLAAALMEIAIMDAASGRIALETDDDATHPVSVCRYQLIQNELGLEDLDDDYLARISSIVGCLEISPAVAQKQLMRMGASGKAICVLSNPASAIARRTAVGFGSGTQDLQLVKNSLGVELYGDFEKFLKQAKPETKDRVSLSAAKIYVGEEEFPLGAMNDAQKNAWLKTLRGQPTLMVPTGLQKALDRFK